uniref:Reverse transcriptase zinc-binding domain-containing protein n=1 Tax=Cannabis sativa TaxID=3483 RepID=A0A803NWR8_CANSA
MDITHLPQPRARVVTKLHRASWDKVCLPKGLGGVGFRDGKNWNKALMAKFLWALANKQDSLWVKWINSIYLKGRDIWSFPKTQDTSWYFKKLLKLRDSTDEAKLRQAVKGTKLKAKVFYNLLVKKPKVQYSKGIWDNLLLPKHRFVYWQIINTQLLTRDFLSKFLPLQSTLCPVCDSEEESHEHIFYRCIFTKRVQLEVNSWLGNYSWPSSNIDLSYRCDFKKHDLRNRLMNMVTAAVYYQIWANRNCCFFDVTCASPKSISLEVRNIVQLRVSSKGPFKRSHGNSYLLNVIKNW